jgi:L-threonylcarbamoyladenylate synthase
MSAAAVARLVAVRGRDEGKPILVLVRDLMMAEAVVAEIPAAARRLAARFWPGPLTLVLAARDGLPSPLTAGTGTIGVRVSNHPTAAMLVAGLGRPVTAPSANAPGATPPRDLETARGYFGARVGCYVDGGALAGGASTVAAIDADGLRVLRPGPIGEDDLRAALGDA